MFPTDYKNFKSSSLNTQNQHKEKQTWCFFKSGNPRLKKNTTFILFYPLQ